MQSVTLTTGGTCQGIECGGDEKLPKKRNNNCEFYHTEPPSSAIALRFYKLLPVMALQYLKYGEELPTDY